MPKQNLGTITLSKPATFWSLYEYPDQAANGFTSENITPGHNFDFLLYRYTNKGFDLAQRPMRTYCLRLRQFHHAIYNDGKNAISCLNVPKEFSTIMYFGNRVPTMADFIPNTMLTNFDGKLQDYLDQRFNVDRATGLVTPASDTNYVTMNTPAFCVKDGSEYNITDIRPISKGSGMIYVNSEISLDKIRTLIDAPKMVFPATPELVKAIFMRQHGE